MKNVLIYAAGVATVAAVIYAAHRWICHKIRTDKLWEKAGRDCDV